VDIEILETTPVDGGTYASLALQGITGGGELASAPGARLCPSRNAGSTRGFRCATSVSPP
jgi:hypothetical protein